jgi:hypothetical protein
MIKKYDENLEKNVKVHIKITWGQQSHAAGGAPCHL